MQSNLKNEKRNAIGIRLVSRGQEVKYKFDEDHFADDSQSIIHSNSSDDIMLNSSLNIIKIDYDILLNQSYIDVFKKKSKNLYQMYFPEAIFKVFQNELNEIIKYQKNFKRKQTKKIKI